MEAGKQSRHNITARKTESEKKIEARQANKVGTILGLERLRQKSRDKQKHTDKVCRILGLERVN